MSNPPITYCPPAFAAPTLQARELSPQHRQILKEHAQKQEDKRLLKYPKRRELRDGQERSGNGTSHLQVQRADNHKNGKDSDPERPQEKTQTTGSKMNDLAGLGTTRLVITELNGNRIEKFRFGGIELVFREDKSGVYLQRFMKSKPVGPSIQLAERNYG